MQIVIEIPEEDYKWVCDHVNMGYDLFKMIANGTPLPKGHGRLIDADVFIDGFEDYYELCELVNSTPTIIEADEEDKE